MKMSNKFGKAPAVVTAGAIMVSHPVWAVSPLDVVLDGRDAASSTNMTEAGIKALAISGGNIILLVAGLVAVILTFVSVKTLYYAQADGDPQQSRRGFAMLALAGCVGIPALIAAIVPYLIGV
jgi:hypothetical protein